MPWSIINREQARRNDVHYLFVHTDGRRAIADQSLRDITNPAATDEGLMLLDPTRNAVLSITKTGAHALVPAVNEKGEAFYVVSDIETVLTWAIEGGVKVEFKPESEQLLRQLVGVLPARSIA